MLGTTRASRPPSPYPFLPFQALRIGQTVSSLIVASVLVFFVHHLRDEGFAVPWTFIVLLTVSLLTISAVLYTTSLYFTRSLAPRMNLVANATLSVLWILGLAFLTWNLGWTLGHRCVTAHWHNDPGIMVCRLYKALTAFTVTTLASTFVALALDLRVYRQVTQLGNYNQMLDVKVPANGPGARSPLNNNGDEWEVEFHDGQLGSSAARKSSHDLQRPYTTQKPIEAHQFGYTAPSEQTSYGGSGEHWL